jgi:hypothetical protein
VRLVVIQWSFFYYLTPKSLLLKKERGLVVWAGQEI